MKENKRLFDYPEQTPDIQRAVSSDDATQQTKKWLKVEKCEFTWKQNKKRTVMHHSWVSDGEMMHSSEHNTQTSDLCCYRISD